MCAVVRPSVVWSLGSRGRNRKCREVITSFMVGPMELRAIIQSEYRQFQ